MINLRLCRRTPDVLKLLASRSESWRADPRRTHTGIDTHNLCAVSTPRAIRPGNFGWVCQAVVIDRVSPSTLKNRSCSEPTQVGCHAASTFTTSLTSSSIRHEPE